MPYNKFTGDTLMGAVTGAKPGGSGVYSYKIKKNKDGTQGYEYFVDGQAITNQQFKLATGNDPAQVAADEPVGAGDPRRQTGDGGAAAANRAAIAAARAEYDRQRANLEPQFNELIGKKRNDLQDDYNTGKGKVQTGYADQRTSLQDGFQRSNAGAKARMAAQGAANSSDMEGWLTNNAEVKTKNDTKLNEGETEQIGAMDKQLKEAKEAIDRAEWNFWNDLPKFGTVEEAMNYKSNLDTQKQSIAEAEAKLSAQSFKSARSDDYAGSGLIEMLEGLNKIKTYGANTGIDINEGMRTWISNFYKNPNDIDNILRGYSSSNSNVV